MYASSKTVTTRSGTASTNASTCSCVRMVPVGLFGLPMTTTLVLGLMAASIASGSWVMPFMGTSVQVQRKSSDTSLYTTNDRCDATRSSPSHMKALQISTACSLQPQPSMTMSSPMP